MRTLIAFLVLLLGAGPACARDLFSIDVLEMPFLHVKDPEAGTSDDAVKIRTGRYSIKAGVPLKMFDGWTDIFVGLEYELLPFTYNDYDFTTDPDRVDKLQALSIAVDWRQKFSDSFALRVFTKPGLYSDFKKITSRSSRLEGGIVAEKTFFGFTIGIGAEATSVFGTRKILPTLTTEYKNRYIRLGGHLPKNIELYFLPTEKLEVGLAARVTGGNFRLERDGTLKGKIVRYSVGTVGPSINLRLSKHITWTLDGGTTFLHDFSTFDSKTNIRDFDLKRAGFLQSGVKFGFGS